MTGYSMATLSLGNLISPLKKELSKQDRNTVHIYKGMNTFPLKIQEMKIVSFVMRSGMRTSSNTEYLIKKAFKRRWLIPRLNA